LCRVTLEAEGITKNKSSWEVELSQVQFQKYPWPQPLHAVKNQRFKKNPRPPGDTRRVSERYPPGITGKKNDARHFGKQNK